MGGAYIRRVSKTIHAKLVNSFPEVNNQFHTYFYSINIFRVLKIMLNFPHNKSISRFLRDIANYMQQVNCLRSLVWENVATINAL